MSWGDFGADALEQLRGVLDASRYVLTEGLPAYSTRKIYPIHEMWTWWDRRQGGVEPLSMVAFPERHYRQFSQRQPAAWTLFRLFFLHHTLEPEACSQVPEAFLEVVPEGVRAIVQLTCVGGRYILSSIPGRSPGEFVYLGDDSAHLRRLALEQFPRGRGRALDLCCGCGVVGLTLPPGFAEVVGLDINTDAIALANSNARLNHSSARFEVSDLYQKAEGEWQLIIGNPPALPPELADPAMRFAVGPPELTRTAVEGLATRLATDGVCIFLVFSAVREGRDTLYEMLQRVLSQDFSLDYLIRQEYRLADPLRTRLRHVQLMIRRDGQGRRDLRWPRLVERLRRWALPGLRAAPHPQLCQLSGTRDTPSNP